MHTVFFFGWYGYKQYVYPSLKSSVFGFFVTNSEFCVDDVDAIVNKSIFRTIDERDCQLGFYNLVPMGYLSRRAVFVTACLARSAYGLANVLSRVSNNRPLPCCLHLGQSCSSCQIIIIIINADNHFANWNQTTLLFRPRFGNIDIKGLDNFKMAAPKVYLLSQSSWDTK